jgi:hypothetical protein
MIPPYTEAQLEPFNTYASLSRTSPIVLTNSHKHWQSVKRLMRYLKQTIQHGLCFQKSTVNCIQAFSDDDWAGSRDDRHSTGGYCIFLSDNLIFWSCRKQQTVARSKLSARHWQTWLQNYPGSSHCVPKLVYDSLNLQHYGVITLKLLAYLQIRSSMHEQNK